MKDIVLYDDRMLESTGHLTKILQSEKYYDIKYIMISLSDRNPLYLIHKPMKFMKTFRKAHIQFTCLVVRFSSIDEQYYTSYPNGEIMNLPTITKEITTITELLNYLHSINRIGYCNKISHANHDETICYEILEFTQFSIIIETDDKKTNFSLNMNLTTEKGKFGPREIIQRLEKIYSPVAKSPKFYLGKKRWGFRNENDSNHLVGIILEESESFLIIPEGDVHIVNNMLYSAYCYNIIYSTNDVDQSQIESAKTSIDEGDHFSMSETIRYNSLWVRTINHFLEYIAYMPFLYTNLLTMIDPYHTDEITHDIDTKITLALYTHNFVELEASPDKPITVAQILDLFRELYKE